MLQSLQHNINKTITMVRKVMAAAVTINRPNQWTNIRKDMVHRPNQTTMQTDIHSINKDTHNRLNTIKANNTPKITSKYLHNILIAKHSRKSSTKYSIFLCYSSSAYQQQDTRYSTGYAQTDYNATQYGASTDYNTQSADYSQTGTYDSRSYSGYGM